MGNVESSNMGTYSLEYNHMVPNTTISRQCTSCLEKKPSAEYKSITPHCRSEHEPTMCTQCVAMWIRRSVEDSNSLITCPQCPLELDYFEVKAAADRTTFQRYETLVLTRMLQEESSFEWCAHACGSGQLHPAAQEEPIMTCHHCKRRTCVIHKLPWHSGVTCSRFDEMAAPRRSWDTGTAGLRFWEALSEDRRAQAALEAILQRARDDEASREEVRRTSQPCPKCGFDIQKDDGCDRMACIICRHVFCWVCLAPFDMISRHGNRWHKRNCRHRM